MFDLSTFFVSVAHAAEEVVPVALDVGAGDGLMRFLPLFLIFIVFYFLLIRPQQKKFDTQTKMLSALKRGDKVFVGGLIGNITKLEGDDIIVVELAKDVQVKALRSSVTCLVSDIKKSVNDDKKK
ncbi:MAG TPA: preprotein translocase subunit YajC [Rhodospirillaceae bacterium]|nr:preprotein translocase subunit YajC [Rhodospirillaceae bacterium]